MNKSVEVRPIRIGAPHPQGPAAVVTRRAADRARTKFAWVYRSDVEQLLPAPGSSAVAPGALVTVLDARGIPLGTALYSAASQITLRLISASAAVTREAYLATLRERVLSAVAMREELAPSSDTDNAHRLLFSEADGTPGIIADRYNDLIILQLLTQGTAQDDVRAVLAEALQANGVSTIVERPDPKIREIEELAPSPTEPLFSVSQDDPKLTTQFTINGLKFHYDASSGQKTGAFLDQRLNYAAAAKYARGKALDICTYQGGFALHMAQVCERVTGVDASRLALAVADRNLEANPSLKAKVNWIEADAFDLLREYEKSGQLYDTIVLDPPAFAKSKRAMEGAVRGYKEMNLRAMKMLKPGGTLITCSCSHHISLAEFTEVVTSAAADSHKRVQLLETRGAAPDHPAIVTLPETSYLKCLIARVG
jgi:23S rRNA (cytosine1962-C5)-methyltransferase